MKHIEAFIRTCGTLVLVGLSVLVPGTDALAGEDAGNWRTTYDLVMMWINFAILAGVLIKFTKTPIKDFLNDRKDEIAREIKRAEEEKADAQGKIDEIMKTLDESEIRFSELKARFVEQGEKERQKIIDNAKEQSRLMLDSAKRKIDSRVKQAKGAIRSEMVDAAVTLAFEKLPETVTKLDDQKYIDLYLANITSK